MLRRLSVQTAGESHGRGIVTTVTGVPAGLPLDVDAIDAMLASRQGGFGRSARQQIEHDRVDLLAGVVGGRTSGAPLVLAVWNRDDSLAEKPAFHRPRPGHADLAGGCKYDTSDMRPVLERASARETAGRVAAGALAGQVLSACEIELLAHVVAVGDVEARPRLGRSAYATLARRRARSSFFCLDTAAEEPMRQAVLAARAAGDTLGGVFEVRARGVPPGLGSLDGFFSRLDARLGAALLSIQAVKATEIGDGLSAARTRGSKVHDAVLAPGAGGPRRASNHAGGVEGGMSNGEEIVARAWMKPIATLRTPLPSWDYAAGRRDDAFFERSDVTAVPAASVVGEAMLALVLLDALLEKTGGDTLGEVVRALRGHRRAVARRFGTGAPGRTRAVSRRRMPRDAGRPGVDSPSADD